MAALKLTVKILLLVFMILMLFSYFSNRDIYRAISKAQSEYIAEMHEEKVDVGLFAGPVMTIDNKKRLRFTWESKDTFEGQKLTTTIIVPRSIFVETEIVGSGPWVEWFKARKKN